MAHIPAFLHVALIENTERIVALEEIYEIKPNGVDGKADYVLKHDLATRYQTNHQFADLLAALARATVVVRP